MNSPALRRAEQRDAERLCEIQCSAIREVATSHYSPEQLAPWWTGLDSKMHSDWIETQYVVVAEVQGEVIGYGILREDRCTVSAVYVDPRWIRRGIGRLILSDLLTEARRLGIASLSCHASLNARDFYFKSGFGVVQEMTHKFSKGGEIRCVEMRIDLGSSQRATD